MAKPIFIKVGGAGPYDPAAGTTDCNIPNLKGMDIFLDHVDPSTYSVLSTGGFRVNTPFVLDAEFFVMLSGISYGQDATDYTNGFCFSQVMGALFGRVGWKQPEGSANPILNSTNLISKGGRKFNDGSFHSLVTLLNIKATMEQENPGDADFNAFIEGLQRAVILRSLNGIFNNPEFIDQSLLYERFGGYLDTPIPNAGRFVGLQIKVPPAADLATQIDSVALYFTEDVTFNLYLFNDIKKAPVWVAPVTAVANTSTVVNLDSIVLNHIGSNNLGGIFYLGYFQDDLGSAQAIMENSSRFKTNKPYSAAMIETEAVGSNDFNRKNIGYNIYQGYGLNPHISVFRDHSWQIVKKASLFDNILGLQMSAQIIEMIMFTKRSNGDERVLRDSTTQLSAGLDLNGAIPVSDGPQTTGIKKQITQEAGRMKDSFFPKAKAQSVSIC
jgi:hypothetical protein